MPTAEQDIIERINKSRVATEPSTEAPTESNEVVNVSEDAPVEEVIETEAQANEEVATETEEPAGTEIAQATDEDEGEDLYVEYKGREINLKDVYETEQGQLRQADYTRKTTEHARSLEAFEEEKVKFKSDQSKMSEQLLTLEAMIAEDDLSSEDLNELREYEPEQYIKLVEKQNKRKEFLKEAKVSTTPKQEVNTQDEQAKLIKANPQWINNGKSTEAYSKDMAALTNYYDDNNFTQAQSDLVNGNALIAQAVIEAARAKDLGKTNAAIEKRVRKAPVSTRPRTQTNTKQADEIKALKAQIKITGDPKLFQKLRQLQRQGN